MANSLGTITPALIAQEALPILTDLFPIVKAFVTDFSNEAVLFNQTVYSRIPSVGTAQAYDTVNGYTPATGTLTDVPVTINLHKHASLAFNDQEMSSTNLNLIEQFATDLAAQMGNDIMSSVAALFTTGNYSSAVALSGASITRVNGIVAARQVLESNKVPTNDRFFITSPVTEAQLLADDSIVKMTWGAQGVSEVGIPDIHGFKFGNYTSLPTTGGLCAAALQKAAVVIAGRVPELPPERGVAVPALITNVTDPKSGLTLQVREFYLPALGKYQVTYTWMYGVAVGSAKSLVRITS
jgi:P22 coat protein - gene protein 5